jgi:hypothetical protein
MLRHLSRTNLCLKELANDRGHTLVCPLSKDYAREDFGEPKLVHRNLPRLALFAFIERYLKHAVL